MTFSEACDIFNAAHPDHEDGPLIPCADVPHKWSEWEFNYPGTCEIRLCANCGIMEQQWIARSPTKGTNDG